MFMNIFMYIALISNWYHVKFVIHCLYILVLQVLVFSSDHIFHWVDKDGTTIVPNGAITGSCSPEGNRIYIIRAKYRTMFFVGNYEEGNEYAEFESGGALQAMDWQYLVSHDSMPGMKIHVTFNCHIGCQNLLFGYRIVVSKYHPF